MAKKPFLGARSLLKGRECLPKKMNITFSMGNEVLNIFYLTTFSKKKKKNFFGENGGEKQFLEYITIF